MASAHFVFSNSRSITHLANYLSQNLPMNSSDESKLLRPIKYPVRMFSLVRMPNGPLQERASHISSLRHDLFSERRDPIPDEPSIVSPRHVHPFSQILAGSKMTTCSE